MSTANSKKKEQDERLTDLETTLDPKTHRASKKLTFKIILRVISRQIFSFFEKCFALVIVFLVVLPAHLLLLPATLIRGRPLWVIRKVTGQYGQVIQLRYFNVSGRFIRNLPLFYHVLSGKIGLVGISIRNHTITPRPKLGYISKIKPGLISLWQVRKGSNIAHEGQSQTDWEYYFTRRPVGDAMLMLRAIPAVIFKSDGVEFSDRLSLLGIPFANTTMKKAIGKICQQAESASSCRAIFFVNPDCLNKSFNDLSYREALLGADQVFPDGIGVAIACRMLRSPLRENINGTDMLPFLATAAAEKNLSLYLLGGKPGVARKMAQRLIDSYTVTIAGCRDGYFDQQKNSADSNMVIREINESGAAILLVAFGAPLQEMWITNHREQLGTGVAMGVGGLFDFYSGNTRRAPRWLREIGLEWLYRMLQEPGRMWRRYVIGNPLFLTRVLLWKNRGTEPDQNDQVKFT